MPRISEATILEAVRRLQEAAPGATVVLFGSYARGDAGEDSDLDFLVIEDTVMAQRREVARLLRVLEPLDLPVDVVVMSRRNYEDWCDRPGTLPNLAKREGRWFDAVSQPL